VGSYRIVGRLGSGGMGWVYLGRSPSGRAVAVKVVRPELAVDRTFRQRFAREVDAAKAVSGAFTAAVIDADPLADLPWLATVYVPGPSLAEAVRADGPLPERQLWPLGAGLVEALQAIHRVGVVHRDLKPSNVLLASDGPRVIDFGISMVGGSSTLTQTGAFMGTPPFMSPEQMTGGRAGPATDVFSLGGVLTFAATGQAPFGYGEGVPYRVVHGAPELADVPHPLRDLVGRCLAKRPGDRPSLATLLEALAPVSDGPFAVPAPSGEDGGGGGFTGPSGADSPSRAPTWPPPFVAAGIRAREADLRTRHTADSSAAGVSVPSCLLLHAQALLDAGLTDAMVAAAVTRGEH
jgi:serine/threonine protein kinase